MIAVFECVALAVKEKGVRGLCEAVPGGPYIFDVACYAFKLYRERKKAAALKAEMEQLAAAGAAEAKKAAEEVARKIVNEGPVEDRLALELYLTQLPGALRQSLKRPADPTGRTVPPELALDSPVSFAQLLPQRLPLFRPGAELPARTGWHLEELLGSGGFGEVWLARHTLIPQPRAVKFCTAANLKAKLTSHEGHIIARVMRHGNHPHVVPLLDAMLDGETPWLMYEFVGGGSLADLILRSQSLAEPERKARALHALAQLAGAVASFHRLTPPIVHRDLKPANILLSAEWKTESNREFTLKITDFGIGGVCAHSRDGSLPFADTMSSLRGSHSPHYASPQQARGAPPDPRDDVHALGVIAYQVLTGNLAEAPSPRFERDLRRRGVGEALIELIGDCIDGDPAARPRDAGELAERVEELRPTSPVPLPAGRSKAEGPTPPAPLPEGRGESINEPGGSHATSGSSSPPPFREGGPGGVGSSLLHALAFALQGVFFLLLVAALRMPVVAVPLLAGFTLVGFALAWGWQRYTIPHWADMGFGMLTFGNLGMLLGWWADSGFAALACAECACSGMRQPWMWVGMLTFANVAMLWFGRGPTPRGLHQIAMFSGGNAGMVLGMLAGGWLAAEVALANLTAAVAVNFAGMTVGMVTGMLAGTWIVERLCVGLQAVGFVPKRFRLTSSRSG